MAADLKTVMDALTEHVKGEMECNPDVIDKGDDLDVGALPIEARKWHKSTEVVAVVADLKGSTNLGVGKHAASTAAIYDASTGGVARIFNDFNADFVAIQGDGVFGLVWGDDRMERALCAGITIKSFSQDILIPKLTKKWPDLPPTGLKVGIAVSPVLAKRVGVPRTDHQEPVWAGKAVNYATKAAQQADAHEMIVTGSIWDFVESNDYLAVTCPCGDGPSASLWSDITIEKIHEGDGERAGRRLTSKWCAVRRYRQDLWMRFRAQRPSGHHLWADDLLSRRLMDGPFAIWSGSKRSLRATGSSQLGHSAPGPSRRHQELQSSHRCSPR